MNLTFMRTRTQHLARHVVRNKGQVQQVVCFHEQLRLLLYPQKCGLAGGGKSKSRSAPCPEICLCEVLGTKLKVYVSVWIKIIVN